MPYNPKIHHRRSIRLKGYDYSQAGLYFITICIQDHRCLFGKIENEEMILNEFGIIAYNEWERLQERFPNVELDVYQIMPNHMHGIIVLNDVGAGFTPALDADAVTPAIDSDSINPALDSKNPHDEQRATARVAPTIGHIVGAYKSMVANGCLEIYKSKNEMMGKCWQRNYYEIIIRNEKSYQHISDYIIDNPANWNEDKFYRP